MPAQLDVYRDWLGITETARPLNYYQLLKLPQFEDDAARIRSQYRQFNARVRNYATGQFTQQSQDLLNELAKAMLCLTDAVRKLEYDASLGRTAAVEGARRTMEQILVGRKVLTSADLDKARRYARTVNVEVRDAVLQLKLAPAEAVMQAYAESVGLPYIDLNDIKVDETLAAKVPPVLARQQSCAPLMVDDGQLLMASPNPLLPEIEERLRMVFGMPVRTVLCTSAGINEVIAKYYPREAAAAQMAAASAAPKASAAKTQRAAAAEPPLDPATLEMIRQERWKISGLAFPIGFGGFAVITLPFGLAVQWGGWYYPAAAGVGAVCSVVTYFVLKLVGR